MKRIAETLGVACSNLVERADGERPKRGPQTAWGWGALPVDPSETTTLQLVTLCLGRRSTQEAIVPTPLKRSGRPWLGAASYNIITSASW